MDYEKLYKEALSRARQFSEHPLQEDSDSIVEYIFPELKESEDEKIRKVLIRFHKSTIDIDGIKGNEIVSWLERQGEQNLIMANSPQLGEQKPFDYEDANIQQKDFAPKSAMEAAKEKKIDNANKVEPKDYNSIDPHFGKPADKA